MGKVQGQGGNPPVPSLLGQGCSSWILLPGPWLLAGGSSAKITANSSDPPLVPSGPEGVYELSRDVIKKPHKLGG